MGLLRSFAAGLSAVLVLGVVGLPVSPAAAAPAPSVPLPAEVDRAAFYEAQTLCDPTPRPGTLQLRDLLLRTYGKATVYIPRGCTGNVSEHFDGRALDWMRSVRVGAERAQVEDFLAWALAAGGDGTPQAMARRLGLMYLIWNNRIIRMYDPGRGWTEYNNCFSSAKSGTNYDTTCHRNHLHISMSWDGASGSTSWYTGRAQTLGFCPTDSSSATPGAGAPQVFAVGQAITGMTPVTPTPVLDTVAGLGAGLGGPCRILAGRTLFPVAPSGVIPAGAVAAAVTVVATSNAPSKLSVWSSGAGRPSQSVDTPIGTTSATVVVPLASDRTFAVSPSLGAAGVKATVVGYLGSIPATGGGVTNQENPTPQAKRASKPRKVRATSPRRSRSVQTRWKPPKSTGGVDLLGFRVEALTSKRKSARVAGTCTAGPTERSCRITGLKKRKKYWISVSVANEVGSTWARRVKVRVR